MQRASQRAGRAGRSMGAGGQIGNVAGIGSAPSGRRRQRTAAAHARRSAQGAAAPLGGIGAAAGRGGSVSVGGPGGPGGAGGGFALTRRHLIAGAVGIGALAALGTGAALLSQQSADQDEVTVLEVPESAVTSSDDLGDAQPVEESMTRVGSFDLPYGTLLWASDDQVAACLVPGETANPLCQAGILSLSSGTLTTVLEEAVGTDEGFQIYDVRAVSSGVVWVEEDILEGLWRVYTATLSSSGTLGTPALADEGGGDWETPSIAATAARAWWQVMPKPDTDASTESSLVKSVAYGGADVQTAWTSVGRLAAPPYAAGDAVVIAPRLDASGVYYSLTCLDAASGSVLDELVLPQGMAPFEIGYGETGFMFSFDAIYDYGDGIANLGTYVPAQDTRQGDYSAAPWFRFSRTPSAVPAWCGGYLMVKSTTSVCGIDLQAGTWFSLGVESGTDDYGDYLASSGSNDRVVTYSNIDHQPLNGEAVKCCRVSVWQPVG